MPDKKPDDIACRCANCLSGDPLSDIGQKRVNDLMKKWQESRPFAEEATDVCVTDPDVA